MARKMRRENWPLTVRFQGGRASHYARPLAPGSATTLAACGARGVPAQDGPVTCTACINLPWSQDQRTHQATDTPEVTP